MHAQFHSIEHDLTLPADLRKQKVIEWCTMHLNLLIRYGLTKEMIQNVARDGINMRQGVDAFLTLAKKQNIPLLIFSGGLGDVIEESLREANLLFPALHIISNFFVFDKTGKVTGFDSGIVCSANKSEIEVKNKPYAKEIENRQCVLLLGDFASDVEMTKGIPHEVVLRVGFLNGMTERLPEFKKLFDVILPDDGDMEYVTKLLETLTS